MKHCIYIRIRQRLDKALRLVRHRQIADRLSRGAVSRTHGVHYNTFCACTLATQPAHWTHAACRALTTSVRVVIGLFLISLDLPWTNKTIRHIVTLVFFLSSHSTSHSLSQGQQRSASSCLYVPGHAACYHIYTHLIDGRLLKKEWVCIFLQYPLPETKTLTCISSS